MFLISPRTWTVVALGAFALAVSSPVRATTIPAVTGYNFSATSQFGTNTNSFGSYSDLNPAGGGASTVYGLGLPFPVIGASSSSSGATSVGSSDARVSLQYYYEVFGPAGTVQVAVNSIGIVGANASEPGYQEAYTVIADSKLFIPLLNLTDETLIKFNNSGPNCCFPPSTQDLGFNSHGTPKTGFAGSFIDTQTVTLTTNVAYLISMYVQASTISQGLGMSGSASATLDPTFSLAPSVVNPQQYTLGFSPGIGNSATATPEPATYLIVGSGLTLLAAFRRRRAF